MSLEQLVREVLNAPSSSASAVSTAKKVLESLGGQGDAAKQLSARCQIANEVKDIYSLQATLAVVAPALLVELSSELRRCAAEGEAAFELTKRPAAANGSPAAS